MFYFIDDNNQIWSTDENGKSNHPNKLLIEGELVSVLGERDGDVGLPIDATFTLHPSLTELAIAIEHSPAPRRDGGVTLEQVVAEAHQRAVSFQKYWIEMHEKYPEQFPMLLPKGNAGLWVEQLNDHSDDAPRELPL